MTGDGAASDLWYSVEFHVESSLERHEADQYALEIKGRILCASADSGETQPAAVGEMRGFRVDVGRVQDDGRDLWDVSDEFHQVTSDYCQALYRRDGHLQPEVQAVAEDTFCPDLLILDFMKIQPSHRGNRVGLLAARRFIELFGTAHVLIACHPFPMQFLSQNREHPEPDLAELVVDEAEAVTRLRNYWARLGFQPVVGVEYWALDGTMRLPTADELRRL